MQIAGKLLLGGCRQNADDGCVAPFPSTSCAVQAGVVTKTAFPKTVTKTVTIKRGYRNAKVSRRDIDIEPEISAVDSSNRLINLDPRQDRHLCPACPAGVQVGKRIGSGLNACCPVRKTVTKTNWRPKTVTVTKKAVSVGRFRDICDQPVC